MAPQPNPIGTASDARMRSVFLAIIAIAVTDARGKITDNCGPSLKRKRAHAAIHWLTEENEDFKLICDWAGLDWHCAQSKFRTQFGGHSPRRQV